MSVEPLFSTGRMIQCALVELTGVFRVGLSWNSTSEHTT